MSHDWVGSIIGGRYQIEALLGQGGMSTVYRAFDPNLSRQVAIKMIHPHLSGNPDFVERFKEEAAAVARLRHPNIVQVHDFNNDGETYYMVMEFLAGQTLQAYLRRVSASRRHLPVEEVMRYGLQISDAAGYAHQRDLVHRDIKPANIMLDVHGQAILMDFGIVKIVGGQFHTVTGATVGTAMYMSPEQIRSERVDERSDLYSIGVLLFEMLSGKPPYEADSALTLMMMHLNDPLPDLKQLRSDTPPGLAAVVEKALAKGRQERYQNAGEMLAALRGLETPTPGGPAPAGPAERVPAAARAAPPPVEAGDEMGSASGPPQPADPYEKTLVDEEEAPAPDGEALSPENGELPAPAAASERPGQPQVASEEAPQPASLQPAAPVKERRRPRWLVPVVAAALLVALALGAIWLFTQLKPPALALSTIEKPVETIRLDTQGRLVSLGQWEMDAEIEALSISPDSSLLAAASNRDWVRFSSYRYFAGLYQVYPGVLNAQLRGHSNWLNSVAFSGDGTLLASGGEDARINIWQVSDGALLRTIESEIGSLTEVAFSPNGKVLAASSWNGVAGIWQLSNGVLLRQQKEDDSSLMAIAFSPDGELLAGGNSDGTIFIWQVGDGSLVRRLEGHQGAIKQVAFSPDGRLVVSASDDGDLLLWQTSDWERIAVLSGHADGVYAAAFSTDGSLLVSGGSDGSLRLWDARDGGFLRLVQTPDSVTSLAFSPDGYLLVSAGSDHTLRFWGVSQAISRVGGLREIYFYEGR